VEDFFREKGILLNFEITAGIPETLPGLLSELKPFTGNWEMADVDLL
jgi:adenylate kinase